MSHPLIEVCWTNIIIGHYDVLMEWKSLEKLWAQRLTAHRQVQGVLSIYECVSLHQWWTLSMTVVYAYVYSLSDTTYLLFPRLFPVFLWKQLPLQLPLLLPNSINIQKFLVILLCYPTSCSISSRIIFLIVYNMALKFDAKSLPVTFHD